MKVYLDNAATAPIDDEVIAAMTKVMKESVGNPSSVHSFGRSSRALIEKARKNVASYINANPSEIFFTSGGTEADNMVIKSAINDLEVKHIITSEIEHHAVLDTVKNNSQKNNVKISFVNVDGKGFVDLKHLEQLLIENKELKTLVSLMHANNEIGSLLPLKRTAEICKQHGVLFHSDTVQTMCHYKIDVKDLGIDFLACSAHKFHGPKGAGFLFINENVKIKPMLIGGSQERNMRAGTENIYGIVGLEKAMEIATKEMAEHEDFIKSIKYYMIDELIKIMPNIEFNGDPKGESLYTVLSVRFPHSDMDEMLLYNLDIEGIAVSGGSACASGSNVGSHVLQGIDVSTEQPSIRFSFSKYTTKKEIDYTINVIKELYSINS